MYENEIAKKYNLKIGQKIDKYIDHYILGL